MGLETQAIIPRHITVEDVCALLRSECGATRTFARGMHRPEYNIIEFVDRRGEMQALNVFLHSHAAEDYQSVCSGPSTLLTLEFSPANYDTLAALAGTAGGYVQRTGNEPWIRVAA